MEYPHLLVFFTLIPMQIKKDLVAQLIEAGSTIEKTLRRKNLTAEEKAAVQSSAVSFVRSLVGKLRKLK